MPNASRSRAPEKVSGPILHPFTVLVLAVATWVAVLLVNHPAFSLVVAVISLALTVIATREFKLAIATVALSLPISLSILIIHAPHGTHPIFWGVTSDGLATAGSLIARLLALTACVFAAAATLDSADLAKAIQQVSGRGRLGRRLAYLAGATINTIPQTGRHVAIVRDANYLRGVRPSLTTIVSHYAVPIVTRLLSEGTRRGRALAAVGFEQEDDSRGATVMRPLPTRPRDWILRGSAILLVVVALGVTWWL